MNDSNNAEQDSNYPMANNSLLQQRLNDLNSFSQPQNGMQLIDLDDPRRNVKPTTWHGK